jgi:membrane-associated phospholipid phosphatase
MMPRTVIRARGTAGATGQRMPVTRSTVRGALYRSLLVASVFVANPFGATPAGAQPSDTTTISTQPLFVRKDAYYAGGFILATIAAAPLDKYFAQRLQRPWVQENRFLEKTATVFRWTGQPGAYFIGAGMYGIGRLAGNERMADLGLHGTEALVVGQLTGLVLKGTFGRARPYVNPEDPNPFQFKLGRGFRKNDGYRSFPSGHTVTGFAAAAAVVTETNRWWPSSTWYVGPLMYGGASLIGLSRMYNNKHWASDVLTGALIGSFAGRKIVRYHHSHPDNRIDDLLLTGSLSRGANGGMALRMSILPGAMALSRR